MPCARSVVVATLAVALWAWPGSFVAHADEGRLTAVVRIVAPRDGALWQRVRGQTVDLDAELVEVRGSTVERTTRAQLRRAVSLAAEHGARVVVWFVHDDRGGITVCVAEPAAGRLFLRQLDVADGSEVARSALAEEAAVVVRSALRALAAGGRIGVEVDVLPAPEPAGDDELPTRIHEPGAARSAGVVVSAVGWQSVADGASAAGFHGLSARLGIGRGRVGVSLSATASLPVTLDDELTSVELSRHALWLSGHVALWRRARTALEGELGVGAVGFFRSTDALSSDVAATPGQLTAALLVTPALRLRWRAGAGSGVLLELVAAADVVLGAPELGYEVAGRFERRDRMWPVQPRVGIGIAVEFGGLGDD